jgi:hypothetical protein
VLGRGDETGRECKRSDVRVAAAFMSTSASSRDPITGCEAGRSFCLPFLSLRELRDFGSPFLFLACARVLSAILREDRASEDLEPLRDRGVALGRLGGASGGSLALWIVRACLAGGGARSEVYKL